MPSTSRAALGLVGSGASSSRQLRTNRNAVVNAAPESEDDDDSDNEPLANNQQSE